MAVDCQKPASLAGNVSRKSDHAPVANPAPFGQMVASSVYMFYIYLLLNRSRRKFYIGISQNVKQRLIQHNRGEVFSTRPYRPWVCIYFEAYINETDARLREKRLKYHGRALAQLKRRLSNTLC